jgi:type I restriction enzyme S subunit
MTEIGEIPEEWRIQRLREFANVTSGNTAPQDRKYFKNGLYPFIRVQHLNNLESGKYLKHFDLINHEAISELKLKAFKKDSIIFPKSGESIKLERRALLSIDSFVANHLAVIETNGKNIITLFLFYYLSSLRTSDFLSKTTMPSLNLSIIKQFPIPFPSLPEQQKIAEILSTADESIQKVNEEITMTEKLKKGLMQTLLTKGIGHTKFKITEIGEIPTEWAIKSISECSVPVSSIDPSIFSHSYFKYIDVSGISSEKLAIVYTKEIQGIAAPSRARKEVKEEDVIFATVRPYLKRVAIVPKNLDGQVCSTAFCVVRAKRNEIMPCFLYYYMTFDKFVNKISEFQTGSAYPAVSDSQVMSQRVPIPKVYEQQKIADILSTVDNKLELFRKKKTHLEKLKKGLMGDLLTGKIRVKLNTSKGEN